MTRLAAEQRAAGTRRRRVRILNVLGLRARESPARALLAPFARAVRGTSQTVKLVDQWLPVHGWDTGMVWERIAEAGTRPHPVYAAGMPRPSCRFCVLASRSALVLAAPRPGRRRAPGPDGRADGSPLPRGAAHAARHRPG